MPVHRAIPPKTALSLAKVAMVCGANGIECDIVMEACSDVRLGRNYVAREFLKGDKTKLFWIDSDMEFEPDAFIRFLAWSTLYPVVCATYRDRRSGDFIATLGPERSEHGLAECLGTGLGFTIVDRAVMEELAASSPVKHDKLQNTTFAKIFRERDNGETEWGEDFQFFADIRATGRKVWLDPTIRLGHIGEYVWTGALNEPASGPELQAG